jgi:S1-C subfamily serine protease
MKRAIGYVGVFVAGFATCAGLWKWAQPPAPVAPRPLVPVVAAPLLPVSGKVVTSNNSAILPSISQAVARVAPAVVNVDVQGRRKVAGLGGVLQPSLQEQVEGFGSGVILTKDGYVLTNNHVIEPISGDGKDIITLIGNDGTIYSRVVIVGRDKSSDLAVLKILGEKNLPVATLGDSDKVEVGDWAIAVGNAMGFNSTVTLGIVSALNRSATNSDNEALDKTIQTDAAINPGNSGGALADINGRVLGINTVIATSTGGNVGIGFAIPINTAKKIADSIILHGRVERPYIGIVYSDIASIKPEAIPAGVTLPPDKKGAVLVASGRPAIAPNSPAVRAGLKEWDVIRSLDGVTITDIDQIRKTTRTHKVGDTMELSVWRQGKTERIDVKLESMPENYEKIAEMP